MLFFDELAREESEADDEFEEAGGIATVEDVARVEVPAMAESDGPVNVASVNGTVALHSALAGGLGTYIDISVGLYAVVGKYSYGYLSIVQERIQGQSRLRDTAWSRKDLGRQRSPWIRLIRWKQVWLAAHNRDSHQADRQ